MVVQFNIDSRHNEEARFKKVLFGYDGQLLEVELNELQDIMNARLGRIVDEVFGSRPLYTGTYAIASGTLNITNELIAMNKELIFIPALSLAVTSGDTIYLNLQEKTVTQSDTIKQHGALTGAGVVTNYLQDSRMGEETTRRVQVTYQLTKIGTGTGTFLKLGTISAGLFVKATDYADSDLYREIRRLASEVITSDGVWTALENHKTSKTDHAAATTSENGFMSATDKSKLDGIATGAEVNQNTFANVAVSGQTTVAADAKSDTLTLAAGNGVQITTNATTDTVTIASANATQAVAGAMSATDKAKLDGIATGAEVNQNAFAKVMAGTTALDADSKTDTLTVAGGNAVTVTGDAATDTMTISVPNATQAVAGALSATDKAKLDGIASGAEVNQNAFSTVNVAGTALAADSKSDTLSITAGNAVTLTPDAAADSFSIAVPNATTAAPGAMSAADKLKLDGIASGASGAQNIFQSISAGGSILVPDSTSDTLSIVAGSNIAITGDEATDTLTIAATGVETPSGAQAKADAVQTNLTNHIGTGGAAHANVVAGGAAGFMTGADKTKLDGVATGAEVNQNAFATIAVSGQSNVAADAKSDTLTLVSGTGVSITTNASTDSVTISASAGTTGAAGILQLSDSIDDTSTTKAATANAARSAYQSAVNFAKSYGLGDFAQTAQVDLNTLGGSGFYRTDRSNVGSSNTPDRVTGDHSWVYLVNINHDALWQLQLAWDYSNVTRWTRTKVNGTWTAWERSDAPATQSKNGYMSATDKTKLDGIATGANNYTHPASHPPSIITQDASNRFVTDSEKTSWNGKASTSVATTSANGLMSSSDKSKLDGVDAGAEVNQNSFATVIAGGVNVVADSKSDTLTIAGTSPVSVTGNATTDTVTIDVANATTTADGLMSAADKSKLNGISSSADVNQNAFSNVKVGTTTIAADTTTDTLELVAGSNISITPDATNDKVTIATTGLLTTTGKAADSNLLDGYNSSQFLRSDTSDTISGNLTVTGKIFTQGATVAAVPIIQRGMVSATISNNDYVGVSVTFPQALATAPNVFAMVSGQTTYFCSASGITTTGCSVYARRAQSISSETFNIMWVAIW